MPTAAEHPFNPGRRRTLAVLVNGALAAIGGALAALLGLFAVRPAAGTASERWVHAGTVEDLIPGIPVPRVLAVPRVDGWYRVRARETVFLVWDGGSDMRALSATCTHLGCQVLWDRDAEKFRCPCHGGAYDVRGLVIEGPPPRPLEMVDARIEGDDGTVLVRV